MVHESWLNPEDWFQTNLIDQTSFYKNLIGKKFIKKLYMFLHLKYMGVLAGT